MTSVYIDVKWTDNETFLKKIKRQTPGGSGVWNEVEAVSDPVRAEYHAAFNSPTVDPSGATRLLFCMEPPCSQQCSGWENKTGKPFSLDSFYKPQRWWVGKTYDELVAMSPPPKTKDLSWITTDKGRHLNPLTRFVRKTLIDHKVRKFERKGFGPLQRTQFLPHSPMDGHILRMEFLDNFVSKFPDGLDLYGRGDFDDLDCYRGEVVDKWDGLADYRYSLAIENYKGPNYFSEKISDALLAWCMPIYWGCTNLSEYLPEDSYVQIDIEAADAPEQVREIVDSDIRERNLDAIAEARELILDRYQIWPTVKQCIEQIES